MNLIDMYRNIRSVSVKITDTEKENPGRAPIVYDAKSNRFIRVPYGEFVV